MNKQTTKRLLASALAIVLALGMLPLSARAATWRDGTYTGVGKGYDGDVKLSVTIHGGVIAAIETVFQRETKAFWKQAEAMLESIVAANSAEVDAVSGATHSCEGIRAAVRSALASASEDAAPVFQSSGNYGGEKTDALHGVAFTKDGGFVAMGYSFGDSDTPEWTHVGNANNNDAILMKFNAVHELEWAKAYATDGVDVFESIDVLGDGRIAALGRQSFNSEDKSIKGVSWYLLVIDPNDPDAYTDYRIGGTAGDQGFAVAATSDGGFVAAGWSASKSGFAASGTMLAHTALGRIDEVMNAPTLEIAADPRTPKDNGVTFRDVSFTYDGAENPALDRVSFRVEPGQTVALVGPSGGGKTTAASLIPRFWDVSSGTVEVGGVDVRQTDPHALMNRIAFVFQNNRLFKASILDNVRAARPDATREEAMAALQAAQCGDILAKLPNGVDTVIGTEGTYLSGGEQQRVALARAILKDAGIVVLDEATAFADPENEALIQKAFATLTKGWTVILIAHRLSTVVNADRIIVLNAGRVVEEGAHDELLHAGGFYARMWADYQKAVSWKITSE